MFVCTQDIAKVAERFQVMGGRICFEALCNISLGICEVVGIYTFRTTAAKAAWLQGSFQIFSTMDAVSSTFVSDARRESKYGYQCVSQIYNTQR